MLYVYFYGFMTMIQLVDLSYFLDCSNDKKHSTPLPDCGYNYLHIRCLNMHCSIPYIYNTHITKTTDQFILDRIFALVYTTVSIHARHCSNRNAANDRHLHLHHQDANHFCSSYLWSRHRPIVHVRLWQSYQTQTDTCRQPVTV